jgi:RNA polymerase sigma factor (sigma-70 family)
VKNTPSEDLTDLRRLRKLDLERVRRIIRQELTDKQREVILAYYFQNKRIPRIAEEWGVHKSSVSRLLRRAENRLKKFLIY